MNKESSYFNPVLPPQLEGKLYISKILSISQNSQVYIIIYNNEDTGSTENTKVLKIIPKTKYNKNVYNKILSINNRYIQKLQDIFLYKNNYYIITEYQVTLSEIICQNGISADDILNIACDISSALKILHSEKILHLDCTPSNIFINNDGSYCLGDFSSSILINKKPETIPSITPGFVPPEISQGFQPGYLSDEYIFSCLLYMLFNDGYTTPGNNPGTDIKKNMPLELYSIISKGCSVNPSDRYNSIEEMNKALDSQLIRTEISGYNYELHITDLSHPLYYLKTPVIKNNTYYNNKKAYPKEQIGQNTKQTKKQNKKTQKKYSLLSVSLILITGIIFLFSLYKYFENKKTVNNIKPGKQEYTDISSPDTRTTIKKTYKARNKTSLDISNKKLKSIPNPQEAGILSDKLTYLYADTNNIDNIDNIVDYTSLKELYLSDNSLTTLSPLEETDNLEILVLSYNQISDLLPVCSLTSLIHLDISGNTNMYNFKELVNLYNLKTLNVTNTNITDEEIIFLKANLPGCEIFY